MTKYIFSLSVSSADIRMISVFADDYYKAAEQMNILHKETNAEFYTLITTDFKR